MPAVPDAAADVPDAAAETSSEADDDNETLGAVGGGSTAYCVATGAAGATTVNDRPGPSLWGTVARIVWPEGTFTRS